MTYIRTSDAVAILKIALVVEKSDQRRAKILGALTSLLGSSEGLPGVRGRTDLLEAIVGAVRGLSDEEWEGVRTLRGESP